MHSHNNRLRSSASLRASEILRWKLLLQNCWWGEGLMTETNVPQGDAFNDFMWCILIDGCAHFSAAVGVGFPRTAFFFNFNAIFWILMLSRSHENFELRCLKVRCISECWYFRGFRVNSEFWYWHKIRFSIVSYVNLELEAPPFLLSFKVVKYAVLAQFLKFESYELCISENDKYWNNSNNNNFRIF